MVRPSSRERVIDSALRAFATAGEDVTLDAVARIAGITKQGVLYHFADKRELRAGMLDAVLARWELHMGVAVAGPLDAASVGERIRAYARVSARGDVVPGEAALFAQVLARPDESTPYAEWVRRLFAAPDAASTRDAARLNTAWLAANSLWSVLVNGKRRLTDDEVDGVLAMIDELTDGL